MSAVSVLPCPPDGECTTLPDGAEVVVRPLEPQDDRPVRAVFAGMGARSRELRFMAAKPRLTRSDLRQLTAVDHHDHVAVVAYADGLPIGVARLVRSTDDPGTADVAVAVVDAWQGRGVGTALAVSLTARARDLGIRRLSVLMAHDNEAAVRLMHRVLGDVEHATVDRETAEFVVSLEPPHRGGRRVLKGV